MINTVFHFVNDPTFDYSTAVTNGDISEYTIVFNAADRSIRCKNSMYGRMSRADMATVLGNISDLLPAATSDSLGAIKIGFTSNTSNQERMYAVQLDENNRAYVSVPWTDTVTPVFDDSELKSLVATERGRIDAFISNLGDVIDQKNRQLYADSQWVNDVFGNGLEPGTMAWAFRNEVDGYLNSYNVWEYIDPEHPELGRKARISEIQQDINGITTRVGTAEENITGITTRTSTLEQTAESITARVGAVETKADATDVALSSFQLSVDTEIGGIKTAHTNLSSSVATYETTNDGNIGNLIKMAAAVLDLKSSSDAQGNLSTTTDLANVITNGSFSGYSGLSQRVSQTESGVSANASLIADVQDAIEGLDIDGAVTRATAGFATETWVGNNYDPAGSASTAETNAKGYADNIVAGAKADVVASIDDVVAGLSVYVTKDTSGYIDSGINLKANQIYLDGQTNFKNAVGAFIKSDVLEAGTATIDAATINSATITGTLSGVDGTFTGTLSAADGTFTGELSAATGSFTGAVTATSGSFKGNVNAELFIAGDEEGLNITVTGDSVSFNYGSDQRAWFTTKKSDGTLSDGMFLYIKNPDQTATNKLITIDFTNLKFENVGGSSQRAIQQTDIYSTMTGSNVQAASNIFKGEFDDLYYNNSTLGSSNLITSTSYHQYIKTGYVVIQHNSKYRLYQAKIYDKVSFSSGVKTNDNQFFAVLYDIAGNVLNGTRMSGASSQTTISDPDNTVILGSGSNSNTVGHSGSLWFNKTNNEISPRVGQAGSGGGVISLYKMQSVGSQGTAIVYDRNVTLYS